MQDFIVGNCYSAKIDDQGIRQTTQDHFLKRIETLISKTVLFGTSVFIVGPYILPPLYEMQVLKEFRPFE